LLSAQQPHRPTRAFGPPDPIGLSSSSRTEARSRHRRLPAPTQLRSPWEPPSSTPHPTPVTPLPSSFHRVKHQLRVSRFIPINTGHSSTLTTGRHPPSAPIKGETPTVLHYTSSHSLSLLPMPKHCPHRVPPPLLLCRRCPVATPPPAPRQRCAGTIQRGFPGPSFRGVPAFLRGSARQVTLNKLHL
jgi:hypothetical protein